MATSTLSTLRARREQIVRGHVDAESNHDVAGVLASFHQPCYDVVPLGVVSDGAAAEILTMHHADTAVILEARMTGTQNGPWAGIEPTGRSMDLRLAAIFEFDEDRLMCEKVYFDFATLLRQLGKLG
jgi:hypothetical protein